MAIALYPGAYKPPHRGHFGVVRNLLDGSHNGRIYGLKDYKDAGAAVLKGDKSEVEDIEKVVVFIGGGERNGITAAESKEIWDIYAKHLGNVEIVVGHKNPMLEASAYAKANPDTKMYAITGIRSEDDFLDLRRISTFKNRENVEGLVIGSVDGGVRATNFRKSLLSGNLDDVLDFFPTELSRDEMLSIMEIIKDSIVAEKMLEQIDVLFENWFNEEPTNEGSSGTHVAPQSVVKSEDRHKLITLYNRIRHQIETPGVKVSFHQDHIKVGLDGKEFNPNFDFTPYMASLVEYMLDQKMNITPLPEVKIKRDLTESENFFGRTAYYDPKVKEVVLFVQGRHPKDVMRSFSHEMMHHMQNIEGRLGKIGTSNTNEDDHLKEIEKEAYLMGNITFRNWEDKIKNENNI